MLKEELILNKLDGLNEKLIEVSVTLAKQGVVLEEHQRRSNLNEENIELLRKEVKIELEPIKKHVSLIEATLKVLGALSVAGSSVIGIIKLISFLNQFYR